MVGLALLASGCAIGPSYRRPPVDAPPVFRGAQALTATNSLADLPWWAIFKDPTLTNLIQRALTNNYDLRIAVTCIEQAREVARQVRSQFFPQVGYDIEAQRGRNTFFGNPNPAGGGASMNAFAAVVNASWELDLWGRIRRLNESARAQFFATEEAQRGVRLSLVSDLAQAYFELLMLDRQLEIAKGTMKSFEESLHIFSQRLENGVASRLETSRAEAALATTAATVPNLESAISSKKNQINLLLGHNPAPVPRQLTLLQQSLPPEVPVGLPSALLERRPDVRQAEQMVRAANAQIGVALGDFLPRIGLTSALGAVSTNLSQITANGAGLWSMAASAAGPLFQGGRLFARYRESKAEWEQAKLQYQQSALNAFREVADALVLRQKLGDIRVQQERAVTAYREAVKVSTQRYLAGRASYYEVLEAQQELFPAENSLAQVELNQLLAIVQLYKALGGGWAEEGRAVANRSATRR